MIRLYGFEGCNGCDTAKMLLQKYGIPYEYIEVDLHTTELHVFPTLIFENAVTLEGLGPINNYLRSLI